MSETTTRRKAYAPEDGDYKMCCIDIGEAENGVTVKCSYALTDEAKAKIMKSTGEKYISYDLERKSENFVFQDKDEAKKHIESELNAMWGDGASE